MIRLILSFGLVLLLSACKSQEHKEILPIHVGGPCEGCETIYEYGDQLLYPTDTLPGFAEQSFPLKLSGTVFQQDGKTPARDVIVYIYHTDRQGLYTAAPNAEDWAQRHGQFRGWIKTDATGKYTFYTFRPAAYPEGSIPEHIHMTVKEPDKNEYYIEDVFFDDDPFLTNDERQRLLQRAGSGIVQLQREGSLFLAQRDIILGLNIPDY